VDALVTSRGFNPSAAPSLLGVPTLVKECHEVAGMPFTGGVGGRRGVVGQVTCPAVQQVRGGCDGGGWWLASVVVVVVVSGSRGRSRGGDSGGNGFNGNITRVTP
jgi:hypothetical protein